MDIIENKTFDAERALYGRCDLIAKNCAFDGPADGESAFKECANIAAETLLFQPALSLLARPRPDDSRFAR